MFSGSVLLCSCCNLVLKELSFEQRVNSKELAFTWLSRCCYGREARQRKKKPPSLRLSLIPIFILSIYIPPPPLLPRSLALPESLAGWKSKWLMRAHSPCSLSPLHFSNKIHSLSPLLSETFPSLFFCPQFGFWFLFFAVCLHPFFFVPQRFKFQDLKMGREGGCSGKTTETGIGRWCAGWVSSLIILLWYLDSCQVFFLSLSVSLKYQPVIYAPK